MGFHSIGIGDPQILQQADVCSRQSGGCQLAKYWTHGLIQRKLDLYMERLHCRRCNRESEDSFHPEYK